MRRRGGGDREADEASSVPLADENDTDLLRFTRTSGDASGDRDATDGIVDVMRSKRRKKK